MKRLALAVALVALAIPATAAAQNSIWATCIYGGQSQDCGSTPTPSWYAGPVTVIWHATGEGTASAPTSTSPCELDTQTVYATDQITSLSCTAFWGTPSASFGFTLQVETSSPTATVMLNRGPDSNGWYNHSVAGAVSASSFSGIASCTSTTYAGPATTSATVAGTCVDNAGKSVTVSSAPFAYDATPPTLIATATPGDQSATLSWQTSGDVAPIASMSVSRTPSAGTAKPAVVFSGDAAGFQDSHLKNGVHYTYTITARDQAGNVAVTTINTTPGPRVLGPAPNAHLTAPPMLSWTPVPGASYYNVQLYRGDPRKVLSLWPATASLQLKHTWRFEGRRYRLKPGKYKWFVWPGFGRREAGRYGHMIGSGTFVVVR